MRALRKSPQGSRTRPTLKKMYPTQNPVPALVSRHLPVHCIKGTPTGRFAAGKEETPSAWDRDNLHLGYHDDKDSSEDGYSSEVDEEEYGTAFEARPNESYLQKDLASPSASLENPEHEPSPTHSSHNSSGDHPDNPEKKILGGPPEATYIRMYGKYLNPGILDIYDLPWEWDDSHSEHILIKREIDQEDLDRVIEYSRELLEWRKLRRASLTRIERNEAEIWGLDKESLHEEATEEIGRTKTLEVDYLRRRKRGL
ncbi:MAG: hypothetical protein Q9166_006650 [cf. Caloplaca sp. 2 TL-2023]